MRLRDALDTWAALRAGTVKLRTRKYHCELTNFVARKWPEKINASPAEISETDLGEFIGRVSNLSDSRFNGVMTMLRATVPAAKMIRRRKLRAKDRPLITQSQFERLLIELDRRPQSHAGLVVRFLAHTGLRVNEARRLRWKDVHDGFILVPAEISKSSRPRLIPFVNGAAGVLESLRTLAAGRETILPQAECKRSLRVACERAGLPRLSHHSFRHLFATRCIESGVDIPTVARWLGHQDGGALLSKTYFHLLDEHSQRMAAKVKI